MALGLNKERKEEFIRAINGGQYVENRVFFKDEETAKVAGYRPYAKCMPEVYKAWKKVNNT